MLTIAEKILLGAVALHVSRVLTDLVEGLRLVLPGYWLYGAIALIGLGFFVVWTSLPDGYLDGLRYRGRYQVVCACTVVGMVLGIGG